MARHEPLIDYSTIDFDNVLADTEEINRINPQRFELQQLTAIVHDDPENNVCVGYKDLALDEFWVRGHMPGMPLMPGVMMLEACAQLCSYYTQKHDLLKADMVGFGGLEEVRFRDPVFPGERLILACNLVKVRPKRMIISRFEGTVGGRLAVEGTIKGICLPIDALQQAAESRK